MEKKKKSIFRKWWVWVIIVLVLAAAGSSASESTTTENATSDSTSTKKSGKTSSAEVTYMDPGHNAGEPTGNVVELDNGNFTTAAIPAGTYDVSNLGWADLVTTTAPLNMISGTSSGTYTGLEIKEETTVEVLNQNNLVTGSDNSPIIFTEVYSDTVQPKEVTEKVKITKGEETCYINNLKADCSELENYESLKSEALGAE